MTKTIAALWNGNLDPVCCFGKNNSEIKQLETLMQKNLEKLEKSLDERSAKRFEAYTDCVNEYTLVVAEQAFCDGFCLGTKIVTEALSNGSGEDGVG